MEQHTYQGIYHHKYQAAQSEFLEQIAYMDARNQEFAEANGGRDNLTGNLLSRYKGIEGRLIRLASFQDAANNLIQHLTDELDRVLRERNRALIELNDLKGNHPIPPPIPYREYICMMVLGTRIPISIAALLNYNEGRRTAIKNDAMQRFPNLFSISDNASWNISKVRFLPSTVDNRPFPFIRITRQIPMNFYLANQPQTNLI